MAKLDEALRSHCAEMLRDYGLLFERKTAHPPGPWPASIEYRVTGGVAYYYNEGKTALLPLALPKELEPVEAQLRSHLGPENWLVWEELARDTNAHLESVTQEWRRILEELGVAAHDIGLAPYEKLAERPLDIYWPSRFLEAIWEDIGYYDKNRAHLWERTKVVGGVTPISMRHTEDTVNTWAFADLPWVLTQSKDAAEMMLRAWEKEAMRAEPRVWGLLQQRSRIESRAGEFIAVLRRTEMEYSGYHKALPFPCSVCKPWIDELETPKPSVPT
jgi:hypothetical protein